MSVSMNPNISEFTISERVRSRSTEGWTIEETYIGPVSVVDTFILAQSFGTAHATYTSSKLSQVRESLFKGASVSAGVTSVVLVYTPDGKKNDAGLPAGTSTIDADSNLIEEPVEKKPIGQAAVGDAAWAAIAAAFKQKGTESYLIPAPTFSYTKAEDSGSFTISEDAIVSRLGYIAKKSSLEEIGLVNAAADPEIGGGLHTKWLYTGRQISKTGDTVQTRLTLQYSPKGWDSQYLYGTE